VVDADSRRSIKSAGRLRRPSAFVPMNRLLLSAGLPDQAEPITIRLAIRSFSTEQVE
jgi:hypothetical protein